MTNDHSKRITVAQGINRAAFRCGWMDCLLGKPPTSDDLLYEFARQAVAHARGEGWDIPRLGYTGRIYPSTRIAVKEITNKSLEPWRMYNAIKAIEARS